MHPKDLVEGGALILDEAKGTWAFGGSLPLTMTFLSVEAALLSTVVRALVNDNLSHTVSLPTKPFCNAESSCLQERANARERLAKLTISVVMVRSSFDDLEHV